jgi:hypothetical protein
MFTPKQKKTQEIVHKQKSLPNEIATPLSETPKKAVGHSDQPYPVFRSRRIDPEEEFMVTQITCKLDNLITVQGTIQPTTADSNFSEVVSPLMNAHEMPPSQSEMEITSTELPRL